MTYKDKKMICKVAVFCGPKVLVLKRSRMVIYRPKRWDLPGGAADPGETKEEAATREVLEEAGLVIDGAKLQLIDTQSKMRDGKPAERFCYNYKVEKEFKPKLSFEHSEYAWMEVKDLEEIDLPNFYKDCIKTCLTNVELL
jgi:8-oxo-dGTP pyrophosphatase MutT (NUDIX family)